jgi:hypothetical protein
MKSALALLAALIGLAGLVALSCTAPLAGAPCPCLSGFEECDDATQTCRAIQDGGPVDGASGLPADAFPTTDGAGHPFDDGGLDPADSGGGSADADPTPSDAA